MLPSLESFASINSFKAPFSELSKKPRIMVFAYLSGHLILLTKYMIPNRLSFPFFGTKLFFVCVSNLYIK